MKEKFRHKNILHWDDERSIDNSLIVSLIHGMRFDTQEASNVHVMGFDTVAEAMSAVRKAIKCDCVACLKERNKLNG